MSQVGYLPIQPMQNRVGVLGRWAGIDLPAQRRPGEARGIGKLFAAHGFVSPERGLEQLPKHTPAVRALELDRTGTQRGEVSISRGLPECVQKGGLADAGGPLDNHSAAIALGGCNENLGEDSQLGGSVE